MVHGLSTRFAGAEASSHSPQGLFFVGCEAIVRLLCLASGLIRRMCAPLLPA